MSQQGPSARAERAPPRPSHTLTRTWGGELILSWLLTVQWAFALTLVLCHQTGEPEMLSLKSKLD